MFLFRDTVLSEKTEIRCSLKHITVFHDIKQI